MPIYEFKCNNCKIIWEEYRKFSQSSMPFKCENCNNPCARIFSVTSVIRDMPEHFNPSTGQYVSSRKQFKEQLARLSAKHTEERGMPVNYVEVDMSDRKSLNVTEEGLDTTYNRQIAKGIREKKMYG